MSHCELKKPLTDNELQRIVQDEQFYDFFDNESDESDSDHESVESHDTNSVLDCTDSDNSDIVCDGANFILGKDKVTKWMKLPPPTSRTRRQNIVTHLPGPKSIARNVNNIHKTFALFFDEYVYTLLVENTNSYITSKVLPNFARSRDAKLVTIDEIKAFVGLLIVSGVMRSSHLNYKDLFSEDDFAGEFFYKTMSYERFLFILRCIRFDDILTRQQRLIKDKLAPIRNLFDNLIAKFSNFFSPSEYVTIDEQLVAFRGRCRFRQYIPTKPNRYGIKLFAMSDARNFYTVNMEVYVGTQPEGPYKVDNSPEEIVIRLLKPIDKTGRNITIDNWYTSIPLAKRLLSHNITTVGTLRKNKKEIPPQFLPNKKKAVKSTVFGFTKSITILSYTPKKSKSVILLSTMHHDDAIDPESGNEKKPEILTFYNMTKGGVDTTDKLCATYDVGRRTRRWPLTLFFHLINVSAVNAFVIYNHNFPNVKLQRRNFLKQLGKELVMPYQISRSNCSYVPRKIRKLLEEHSEPAQEETGPTNIARKRCYLCPRSRNRHSKQLCLVCKKNICSEHTKNICNVCYK